MKSKSTSPIKAENDYLIFFIFMTIILIGMYLWSLIENPALHQFWPAALFTLLMAVHIILHWLVVIIIQDPIRKVLYIVGQGILAFFIVQLSGNMGMVFSLYMALIGETIGFLGINRWSTLSTAYYLSLSLTNFIVFTNADSSSTAVFWLLTSVPVVIFTGMYVTLYTRQAEAREKAQSLAADLEIANKELSDYAARIEDLTIAAERQRMARELHDTLSQGLAGLILQLEAADAHLSSNRPDKAHTIVQQTMQRARATLSDARLAIEDLRQNGTAELKDLLRLEISHFTEESGITCDFQMDLDQPVSDTSRETAVRTVSEALTNITRHAQANRTFVNVKSNDQTLEISIRDDGKGFDPADIQPGHYGLMGIKERVRLIGGKYEIKSSPEKGTILSVKIPLIV